MRSLALSIASVLGSLGTEALSIEGRAGATGSAGGRADGGACTTPLVTAASSIWLSSTRMSASMVPAGASLWIGAGTMGSGTTGAGGWVTAAPGSPASIRSVDAASKEPSAAGVAASSAGVAGVAVAASSWLAMGSVPGGSLNAASWLGAVTSAPLGSPDAG